MIPRWALGLVFAGACAAPTGTFDGRVVDPWTGKGRAGVRVVAVAPADEMDAACQVTEATTGPDGAFHLEHTCADVTYTVRLDDQKLVAPELPIVKGGTAEKAANDIVAWRIPGASGVYLLKDDKLDSLHMNAAVEGAWIQGTDKKETALYPTGMPNTPPAIGAGDVLVLSGESTVSRLKFYPLISHPGTVALELASGAKMSVTDAWYLGYTFESDTKFTKQDAAIDESKVKSVGTGADLVKMYPSDALPPGRYALIGDEDSRMLIVDFGGAVPTKGAM